MFAPEVLRAAGQRARADPQRLGDLRDLRSLQCFSIDDIDMLDLGPLPSAETLPDGSRRLALAVAHLDSMVHRAGLVDTHAAKNTTSVDVAAGDFPRLPTLLSTDRRSFHERQEQLAVVMDMMSTGKGRSLSAVARCGA